MTQMIFSLILGLQAVFAQETSVVNTDIDKPVVVSDQSPQAAQSPQAENEIPLNLGKEKKDAPSENFTGRVVYSVIVLLMLGLGLFFFLRKYATPKNSSTTTQIKVISQHHFGPKRSLALVRVAGESMLIGITDQSINLVKSLSLLDEDVPEETPQNFQRTLKSKTTETELSGARAEAVEDEFTISGIKDVVSRKLQSMRNI